jgi:hypothetical protein
VTDLKAEIERVAREHLVGAAIDAVRVSEERDDEGERFFKVTIVYASDRLDTDKMKGLVRHLRSALTDDRSFTFPLVSYRSRKDDMRLQAAAA